MAAKSTPPGPLAGVYVADLATERAELAGRVLADLGAQVLKIEPLSGAAARRLPPFEDGQEGDLDGSLYWAAVARGKRSLVLDLDAPADRERLRALLAGVDILVESFDPGVMHSMGLDRDALRALNPALIVVSVTPYGQTGPDARSPATELTVAAAGGLLGLQGDGDRPPIPVGFPQAAFHAGVQAAADALIALVERQRSGRGQHLDVSMQAVVTSSLLFALTYPAMTGADPPGTGECRCDPPVEVAPGLSIRLQWELADGVVHGVLGAAGGLGGHTTQAFRDWMDGEHTLNAALAEIDWSNWLPDVLQSRFPSSLAREMIAAIQRFCAHKSKQELLAGERARNVMVAPVHSVADLRADPHLQAHGYWETVDGREHPGPFARLSRTPVQRTPTAPALGEDQALLTSPQVRPSPARPPWNLLSGKMIDANEAEHIGLLSRIVPDQDLQSAVEELLAELRLGARMAQRAIKRIVRHGLTTDWRLLDEYAMQMLEPLFDSRDHREALSAFVEKRDPQYENR